MKMDLHSAAFCIQYLLFQKTSSNVTSTLLKKVLMGEATQKPRQKTFHMEKKDTLSTKKT